MYLTSCLWFSFFSFSCLSSDVDDDASGMADTENNILPEFNEIGE